LDEATVLLKEPGVQYLGKSEMQIALLPRGSKLVVLKKRIWQRLSCHGYGRSQTCFKDGANRRIQLIRFINFYNTVKPHKILNNTTP